MREWINTVGSRDVFYNYSYSGRRIEHGGNWVEFKNSADRVLVFVCNNAHDNNFLAGKILLKITGFSFSSSQVIEKDSYTGEKFLHLEYNLYGEVIGAVLYNLTTTKLNVSSIDDEKAYTVNVKPNSNKLLKVNKKSITITKRAWFKDWLLDIMEEGVFNSYPSINFMTGNWRKL